MYGRRWRWYSIPVGLLALLVFFIIIIDMNIRPALVEVARAKAQLVGMESINKAVNNRVVGEIEYQDLVYVHKDARGQIVLIQPNTIKINQLMSRTLLEVTDSLEGLSDRAFYVPLGQVFGSSFLAGYGPKIKVKILPTGIVDVDVTNKLEGAGINQTRHLIYLIITSKLKIAVPFMDEEVKVSTTVPVAETIIVGKVPDTYINLNGTGPPFYPMLQQLQQ